MKKLSILALVAGIAMIAGLAVANVPAPPVNQDLGFDDHSFNELTEAECRVCHDSGVPDDHHLLYGSLMPVGECSGANGTCTGGGAEACLEDADCPVGETCTPGTPGACYTDAECTQPLNACNIQGQPCPVGLCDDGITSCQIDSDCAVGDCNADACPSSWTGQYCSQPFCFGSTAAPNNPNAGVYGCLSCHDEDNTGGVINFIVYRDCTVCHVVGLNQGSVHHIDEQKTGAKAGNCTQCHGDIVDDVPGCKVTVCDTAGTPCLLDDDCPAGEECIEAVDQSGAACDDGHVIPTYDPSLVTPAPVDHALICQGAWGGSGDPCTTDGDCSGGETCQAAGDPIPGACNYCHEEGTDTASGVVVENNHDTHHHSGVYKNRFGGSYDDAICAWCHKAGNPHNPGGEDPDNIRWCEGCHGLESLHNIQVDTNGGGIVAGGEDAGYGHIGEDTPGADSDCWGCHGFGISAEAELGSGVPTIFSAEPKSMTAGADTAVAITGTAFLNGTLAVSLTDAAGNAVALGAADVTDGSLTTTVNAPAGSYTLQVVKDGEASNAIGIAVVPAVAIAEMDCSKCLGTMTITGSGFAAKPAGTDEDISVTEDGRPLNVINWSDTEITVSGARCRGDVEVNSVFGSSQ